MAQADQWLDLARAVDVDRCIVGARSHASGQRAGDKGEPSDARVRDKGSPSNHTWAEAQGQTRSGSP